jgi:uncharacterized surface protein with fasciclin (FAS1) repeats
MLAAGLAGAFGAVLAGCGAAAPPAARPGGSGGSHQPMHSHHPMTHAMSARFGPDCGMVPATGAGSFHSMSMEPVVAAATHNPLLSTFAADAVKAGLASRFNAARGVTVFAPENSAFAGLHGQQMTMLEHHAELAAILSYHVVAGRVTPAELAAGTRLHTLQGQTLRPARMGSGYEVNGAEVICGNIQTANAIVYIINKVLQPMHMH